MHPLVTIAIPTLNRTRYLRETLNSVLAQDYPNLEIIVSDNGSVDGTPALAHAIARGDRRVRFRRNKATVPIVDHLNQLVAAARGDYFAFLCDDDWINPTFITELVGVAVRHRKANVVLPAGVIIDEQDRTVRVLTTPDSELLDGPDLVCYWLYQREPRYFENFTTMLTRTAVLRHFGGYRQLVRGLNADNLLFLQCAVTGPVGFAPAAKFHWRVYDESHGSQATPQHLALTSRQFVDHLRTDPRTVDALEMLPGRRRQEIIDGVRQLTAQEFLRRVNFYDAPLTFKCLRAILTHHFDHIFYREIVRDYVRRHRTRRLHRQVAHSR